MIDVGAGYQRLCGEDALDYVRYRHLDNDLIRAARQQSFLGKAKNQIGIGSVFSDRKELLQHLRPVGAHRHRLAQRDPLAPRLVAESADKPIQEVQFPAQDAGDGSGNVVIGPSRAQAHGRELPGRPRHHGPARHGRSPRRAKRTKRSPRRQPSAVAGLIRNRNASENIAAPLQVKLGRLPVYYPTLMSATGSYRVDDSRAYDIVDRANKRHRAYRIVAYDGRIGQYYGMQGTDWRSPPILDNPSSSVTSGGRTFKLFYDGSRLKLVAWRTRRGLLLGLQHAPAHADQQADARARPLDAVARRALASEQVARRLSRSSGVLSVACVAVP